LKTSASGQSGRPQAPREWPLLNGVSWGGFGLIALLFGIWTLHFMLSPSRLRSMSGGGELLSTWLSFWGSMLVGGEGLLVVIVILLNVGARAGISRPWVVVPAAAGGCVAAALLSGVAGSAPDGLSDSNSTLGSALFWADWAAGISVAHFVLMRLRAARAATQQLELQRKSLENRRMEARLRVLQAQIEPHFLFNTLSNIRRLCQQDVQGGRSMLAQLALYLHAALPKIRRDNASLADEIELVKAYLALHKIRMGERLAFAVEAADNCLGQSIPPMMIVTLAENAVKHGLAPLTQGGSISVRVARDGESMKISVADTGGGFVAESGGGVGLANLRAQLAALFGGSAALTLRANVPQGVVATITLPWRTTAPQQ
jgi:two-component sensor histidine kinase